MKINTEIKKNPNGTTTTIQTIEKIPEDGLIPLDKNKHTVDKKKHKNYSMGYSRSFSYTTDDPRIMKLFLYIICFLFIVIGLIAILLKDIMGIFFIIGTILIFLKYKKKIDTITKKLTNEGYDVIVDSKEEKEEIKKEINDTIIKEFKNNISFVFAKKNFKWFFRISFPIYCIVSVAISILSGFIFELLFGINVLIMLILFGLIFFYIASKIFKY